MTKHGYSKIQTTIQKFSSKGFGIGSVQKTADSPPAKVEVPFTVPGDIVEAEVGRKRRGAYFGKLSQVLDASTDRVAAPCIHAPSCGGCVWQQVDYARQLKEKEAWIKTLFCSITSETTKIHPILAAESIWQYRNKMEYTFSQNASGERFLGLMMAGTKGKVQTLQECHLTSSWFVEVLHGVYKWWEQSGLEAYRCHRDTGSLRTLILREGKRTGHKMAMLTVSGNPDYGLKRHHLTSFVSSVKASLRSTESLSLFLRIQQALRGSPTQFYEMVLDGPDHILERLHIQAGTYQKSYTFKISPTAFFQPNPRQAERLYAKALEIAGMQRRRQIWDLYAGTATLGMIFAPFAEKVIAVEINPHAVFDAESNKEENAIDNLTIYKGDVDQVLRNLRENDPTLTHPDLIVLDPPRSGLSESAMDLIMQYQPKEILYISCNPATQARDCMKFFQNGYQIVEVQPVDQFPHTVHVENIVLLRR
jgi:23S rRNA (uracil1939-C5)-methyltransferase